MPAKLKEAKRLNSITKRWVRGSLLITILMLVLAETIFLWAVITNHYSSVQFALENRAQTLLTQANLSDATSAQSKSLVLRRLVEQFTEKDKFELMLLNNQGHIVLSSSGYVSGTSEVPQDFSDALLQGNMADGIFYTDTGEKTMALTLLLNSAVEDFSALRIVTSLTLVDSTIVIYIWVSIFILAVILLFSVWSGLFFIRSIVNPIAEIEKTAEKIAKGNFDIRLQEEKRQDEIGKLVNTINHMAAELEQAEKMKNEFISSVSHELRTPLTSIKGWVETLRDTKNPPEELYTRGFSVLGNETDRLYNMVEELLDFSHMQHGIVLNCNYLDLTAEVSESVIIVLQRANKEGVNIIFDEPPLPIPVYADAARLRQAFINLLDNAVKYSPKNSDITVSIKTHQNSASVIIKDNGKGILKRDLPHIKTKFFKGKNSLSGNGIGLAVVNEIAVAHNGALDIDSVYTKGTSVKFTLPIKRK